MSNTGWSEPYFHPDRSNLYQRFISRSEDETRQAGFELGSRLKPDHVVCFFGDLGAGKTTFIKGVAVAVTGGSLENVNSPTYVYLNIYEGINRVYHFDLYRLHDTEEFLGMGFDEYFFSGGVCCLEWSEKIDSIIPEDSIRVVLINRENQTREISIYM